MKSQLVVQPCQIFIGPSKVRYNVDTVSSKKLSNVMIVFMIVLFLYCTNNDVSHYFESRFFNVLHIIMIFIFWVKSVCWLPDVYDFFEFYWKIFMFCECISYDNNDDEEETNYPFESWLNTHKDKYQHEPNWAGVFICLFTSLGFQFTERHLTLPRHFFVTPSQPVFALTFKYRVFGELTETMINWFNVIRL